MRDKVLSGSTGHYSDSCLGPAAGLGMNGEELARNKVLTEYAVKDLNLDPQLPYEDNSFDVITNAGGRAEE